MASCAAKPTQACLSTCASLLQLGIDDDPSKLLDESDAALEFSVTGLMTEEYTLTC